MWRSAIWRRFILPERGLCFRRDFSSTIFVSNPSGEKKTFLVAAVLLKPVDGTSFTLAEDAEFGTNRYMVGVVSSCLQMLPFSCSICCSIICQGPGISCQIFEIHFMTRLLQKNCLLVFFW
ncbi:hypothetical protein OPV22_017289 [Ensete ventricosum]|uniref:MSP domain-containing protein n=1 Tax=Ensete ventricosum TaxID=4639 RepID=A0AAV8QXH9_ENSVE|nr:hypothetical protein OPV22_017289 [Ensete ventricosum]